MMGPVQNENSTVYLDEEGVFVIEWKAGKTLEKDDLEVVVKLYDEWSEGALWKVLHLFPKDTTVSTEGRQYGESRENPAGAEAFVILNLAQRILFNFYRRFRSVQYPIRDFSSEEAARKWLDRVVNN